MKKIILVALMLILSGCTLGSNKDLSLDEAKAKAEAFANNNLVQPGYEVTAQEITEVGGVYKLVFAFKDRTTVDSYMSKDGQLFFPQVINMAETTDSQDQSAEVVIDKSEKPEIELFVMSHCPYGTQMEKGLLPVLDLLGDKVNFELKFVDYAMHDKIELDEELLQYCIQRDHQDKLLPYLSCFLKAGETASCLTEVGLDGSDVNSCIAETDAKYAVSASYADQSVWQNGYPPFNVDKEDVNKYQVGGSPALFINGTEVSNRDSASLLGYVCSAFLEEPEECSTEMSSQAPSAGFGYSQSGSATTATCN